MDAFRILLIGGAFTIWAAMLSAIAVYATNNVRK